MEGKKLPDCWQRLSLDLLRPDSGSLRCPTEWSQAQKDALFWSACCSWQCRRSFWDRQTYGDQSFNKFLQGSPEKREKDLALCTSEGAVQILKFCHLFCHATIL